MSEVLNQTVQRPDATNRETNPGSSPSSRPCPHSTTPYQSLSNVIAYPPPKKKGQANAATRATTRAKAKKKHFPRLGRLARLRTVHRIHYSLQVSLFLRECLSLSGCSCLSQVPDTRREVNSVSIRLAHRLRRGTPSLIPPQPVLQPAVHRSQAPDPAVLFAPAESRIRVRSRRVVSFEVLPVRFCLVSLLLVQAPPILSVVVLLLLLLLLPWTWTEDLTGQTSWSCCCPA